MIANVSDIIRKKRCEAVLEWEMSSVIKDNGLIGPGYFAGGKTTVTHIFALGRKISQQGENASSYGLFRSKGV